MNRMNPFAVGRTVCYDSGEGKSCLHIILCLF